jgi:hypothetical protein
VVVAAVGAVRSAAAVRHVVHSAVVAAVKKGAVASRRTAVTLSPHNHCASHDCHLATEVVTEVVLVTVPSR